MSRRSNSFHVPPEAVDYTSPMIETACPLPHSVHERAAHRRHHGVRVKWPAGKPAIIYKNNQGTARAVTKPTLTDVEQTKTERAYTNYYEDKPNIKYVDEKVTKTPQYYNKDAIQT